MSKITYTDKVALNVNSDIADINKVNASDLNEIKDVVNSNDDNMGLLSNLNTTDKTSIVNAINEVITNTKVSIAKITTNGEGSYTSAAKVTGIWVNDFSVGDIVAEASNSRIKITNTEILETGGLLGGKNSSWSGIYVYESTNLNNPIVDSNSVRPLYQFGSVGNGYWSAPLPKIIYQLDKTKTYYAYLQCAGYNGTFELNSGMGNAGTSIYAQKIK